MYPSYNASISTSCQSHNQTRDILLFGMKLMATFARVPIPLSLVFGTDSALVCFVLCVWWELLLLPHKHVCFIFPVFLHPT